MKPFKSQNYYQILGISREALPEDIRKAYELSRHTFQENSLATYSLFTEEENQELLALISRAYETLFSPELRREYDEFLDNLEQREGPPQAEPVPGMPPPQQSPMRLDGSGDPLHLRPAMPHEPLGQATLAGNTVTRAAAPSNPAPATPPAPPPQPSRPEPAVAAKYEPAPKPNEEQVSRFVASLEHYSGPALRKVRQLRGYSVEDMAEHTKIRKTYIEYIETEQFTFLPAPIYIKGFVVLIATMLELPGQEAADSFMTHYRSNGAL